ncbi:MAG TPA: hypothetical protein VI300_25495 [Solirubrobacter sp.]
MHWEQLDNGRVAHSFEWAIVGLALLVVPVILIEESHPSDTMRAVAAVGNWIIWVGFAAELTFVLTVAPRRKAALGTRALAALRTLTSRQGFRYVALATVMLVLVTGFAISVADKEEFSSPWVGMWWRSRRSRPSATATTRRTPRSDGSSRRC